jgi:quercetin dioxygenase-like cupin family protein
MSRGDIFESLQFPKGGPDKTVLAEMDGFSVIPISLGKGARIPPHMASHSAVFFVLRGRAIITSGVDVVELGENQYIVLETNQMRGIQALEDLVILGVRN